MAGNIIPAIATTNAITAGIVVMRTFRVLKEEFTKCQSVYVRLVLNPRNQLFVPEKGKFYWPTPPPTSICSMCVCLLHSATQLFNRPTRSASFAPANRPLC